MNTILAWWSLLSTLVSMAVVQVAHHYRERALRAEKRWTVVDGGSLKEINELVRAAQISLIPDPGKQALEILRRGDNCDWYSLQRNDHEMHEGFDCLEIYWRTTITVPDQTYPSERRFEDRAGFRVRWHVSAANTSFTEAYGLDLLTTILEARDRVDQFVARANLEKEMGHKHPALEAWKAIGEKREYCFQSTDLDVWRVRLEYPGGIAWAEHTELDQAVSDALAKAPQ